MATRVYIQDLAPTQSRLIQGGVHHHLARVLRKRKGDCLELFDGMGQVAQAEILSVARQETSVRVSDVEKKQPFDPVPLILFQALSKGERMEFALQKSVEIGVSEIYPIITHRSDVRLDEDRLAKKQQRWQQVIISACEQSGQNFMPKLNETCHFGACLEANASAWQSPESMALILSPDGRSLDQIQLGDPLQQCGVLVGPEGGFTDEEIALAKASGAAAWQLGPRILRTETAGLVALSVLQYKIGAF